LSGRSPSSVDVDDGGTDEELVNVVSEVEVLSRPDEDPNERAPEDGVAGVATAVEGVIGVAGVDSDVALVVVVDGVMDAVADVEEEEGEDVLAEEAIAAAAASLALIGR
jgi:hypothetical protein